MLQGYLQDVRKSDILQGDQQSCINKVTITIADGHPAVCLPLAATDSGAGSRQVRQPTK